MNVSNSTSNCFERFRTAEFVNVGIARAVSASVSLLMCVGALLLIVVLKRWQFFSQKLIIYIFTAATLASMGAIISVDYFHRESAAFSRFCAFSGFVLQTTGWMLINAIFAVTLYLFVLIVLDYNTNKYQCLYVFGIFFLPLLVNWIPFLQSAYGKSGVWCWIKAVDEETCEEFNFGQYLQLFLFYAPILLLLFVEMILYLIIIIDISKKQRKSAWANGLEMQSRLKKMKREFLSLAVYPVIFVVVNIVLMVNRVYILLRPNNPSLALWYFSAVFGSFKGISTAAAFTILTKPWKDLSCRRVMATFKRDNLIEEYPLTDTDMTDSFIAHDHAYSPFQNRESSTVNDNKRQMANETNRSKLCKIA